LVCYVELLLTEILNGLQKAKTMGIEHCTMAIDTWGVDYGLLDKKDQLLGLPTCYNNSLHSVELMEQAFNRLSKEAIWQKTAIAF
jgi:rhamnulokinase